MVLSGSDNVNLIVSTETRLFEVTRKKVNTINK